MRFFLSIFVFFSMPCLAEEVHIDSTDISFIAPDGFLPLSQELIDIKWPSTHAPRWAVGNERGTTTIAFDLKENDISDWPIETLGYVLEDTFNKNVPNLQWKRREIIELSNRKWVYLELTSSALDTDIYNMLLATSYQDKMLIFNFNSTKTDIIQYKDVLRKSVESIKIGNDR